MNEWERYWFGDVAAVRPWLLQRTLLLLLAFDAWLVMAEHGGRYAGDFNVPHFGWLAMLQPTPSPGQYVGMVLLCGVLAFALALGRPSRLMMGGLCAVYTYAWMMSMVDSYQHHYLLSLLLLSMVFFPRLVGAEAFAGASDVEQREKEHGKDEAKTKSKREPAPQKKVGKAGGGSKKERRRAARRAKKKQHKGKQEGKPQDERAGQEQRTQEGEPGKRDAASRPWASRSISAWAWALFGATCGLVYFYTAIAKMETDWREGHVIKGMTAGDEVVVFVQEAFVDSLGISVAGFWELVGTSVVLLQIVIGAGYLVAVRRDTSKNLGARVYCWIALLAALSFHFGAEYLGLKIGWFSWYMIVTALVYMLPRTVLEPVAWVMAWPGRAIATQWDRLMAGGEDTSERPIVIALGIGGAGLVVFFGHLVDLPGALVAGVLGAVVLALGVLFVLQDGRIREAQRWIVATSAGAAVMWASIAGSDVRFDYYRLFGGDMRRRGNLEESLAAYVKANEYAPRDPAQDVRGAGDCGESLGWAWNGDDCVELFGCECKGGDCDALSEDEEECSESFAADRDEKEQELRRRLGLSG